MRGQGRANNLLLPSLLSLWERIKERDGIEVRQSLHSIKALLLSIIFSLFSILPLNALTTGSALETVTVQFEVSREIACSREAFTAAVETAMEKAMDRGPADLVIFPEYLGVFASLISYSEYLKDNRPFELVWKDITEDYPDYSSLSDLFIRESKPAVRFLDALWAELAREYGVYILSGTRFEYDPVRQGVMNRAVVYDPEGKAVYKQDKYFLTEFEQEILNLIPGNPVDNRGFSVKGRLIRLTICRDTFLKQWETLYREGDLWVDIKANGEIYLPDQAELFTRALPARLPRTPIPYGITACLTGTFLNLLWQGESSIIKNDLNGKVIYLDKARHWDSLELLRKTFP